MAQNKPQANESKEGGNRVFYLLGLLIVVAGAGWLMSQRGGLGSTAAMPSPAEFEGLAATAQPDKNVGIPLGNPDAPIEIMEFADYSCPHCAQFSSFAGKLLRQNYVEVSGAPVRWITFDFVLGGFPNTISASMAARCAGEQDAYWIFHDMLFARQARWYTSQNPGGIYDEIADDVGLDQGAFRSCMSEGRYLDQIAAARKYGESLGVGSTPTIFINGRKLDMTGVEPYSFIEAQIQAALAAAESSGEASGGSQ